MPRFPARAHPHVCGEHIYRVACYRIIAGSSPRMRGTQAVIDWWNNTLGLIPTYAGNTVGIWPIASFRRAHPHVCGEHGSDCSSPSALMGSSPRMRGTLTGAILCVCDGGLIPTYAGNTLSRLRTWRVPRAHPHVCGEHFRVSIRVRSPRGSSPRMRGTHPS